MGARSRRVLGIIGVAIWTIAFLMDPPKASQSETMNVTGQLSLSDLPPRAVSGNTPDIGESTALRRFLTEYVSTFTATGTTDVLRHYAPVVNPFFNFKKDTTPADILADGRKFARRFTISTSELRELKLWDKAGERFTFSALCFQRRFDKTLRVTDDSTFIISGSVVQAADGFRVCAVYTDQPRPKKLTAGLR